MPKIGANGQDLQTLDALAAKRDQAKLAREVGALDPVPNGVSCPACGEELYDDAKLLVLQTTPPQKPVHCPKCNWKGLRRA